MSQIEFSISGRSEQIKEFLEILRAKGYDLERKNKEGRTRMEFGPEDLIEIVILIALTGPKVYTFVKEWKEMLKKSEELMVKVVTKFKGREIKKEEDLQQIIGADQELSPYQKDVLKWRDTARKREEAENRKMRSGFRRRIAT